MAGQVTTGNESGALIKVEGFDDTMAALSLVDEDLRKRLLGDLKQAGSMVAERARQTAPRGPSGDLRAGYKTSLRQRGKSVSVKVENMTPQGQILEFAGSKSDGVTTQGKSLIATLRARYGEPGRFMWESYDRLESTIAGMVQDAVDAVDAELDAKLNGADGA